MDAILQRCAKLICSVYAPPNAAKEGCQVFDEETGKAKHVVRYDLYSEMGQRLKGETTRREACNGALSEVSCTP